ncbi:hypothetical protein V5O48_015137 [Marasmius crinis-equi]|uniref:Uncharacterized protein n=1 Tax=Marasmius crinis-equi TaxID=585013 RepID=A0ABR3EVM9_9AGAR
MASHISRPHQPPIPHFRVTSPYASGMVYLELTGAVSKDLAGVCVWKRDLADGEIVGYVCASFEDISRQMNRLWILRASCGFNVVLTKNLADQYWFVAVGGANFKINSILVRSRDGIRDTPFTTIPTDERLTASTDTVDSMVSDMPSSWNFGAYLHYPNDRLHVENRE